jgi:hypothetical protein
MREHGAAEGRKGLETALQIAETQGARLFADRVGRELAVLTGAARRAP